MSPFWSATLSVAVVSAVSAVGALTIGLGEARVRKAIFVMVAFAVGGLFGDVFLHMLPELMENGRLGASLPWWLMGGFLLFFALEKFIRWRHCHLPDEGAHVHPVAGLAAFGDALHNTFDGLMIGAAWQVSPSLGLATTAAVFFHELPQELGDFGVLLHAGLSFRKALALNLLSAATAFVGLGLSFAALQISPDANRAITAATAGGFLYIAGSDLVPELHHELDARRSLGQFGGILAGLGVMAALKHLLG